MIPEATFIGANPQSGASDYNRESGTLLFGAGNLVAVWDPMDHSGVAQTLKHHKDTVLNVKFLDNKDKSSYVVSTSADSTVALWQPSGASYKLADTQSHTGSVVCLSVVSDLVVTSSADGQTIVWRVADGKLVQSHVIKVAKVFRPLASCLYTVGPSQHLLFLAGSSVNLFVYAIANDAELLSCVQCAALSGHENWIKSVVAQRFGSHLLVATGSLDRSIRLWKVSLDDKEPPVETQSSVSTLTLLSNKKTYFTVPKTAQADQISGSINFEALIFGHDDWVASLQWSPREGEVKLLSASADTCLMLWEPDQVSGVWVSTSRLGELSIKGASTATGASGGFWSSVWFVKDGVQHILTHGKTGSWRYWSSENGSEWNQNWAVTGSIKPATDVCWSKSSSSQGSYLLATSLDQTTRLYAPWPEKKCWAEFSRPQIHGYDMMCVSSLSDGRFVSGGDEKILRVFEEPKLVADLLAKVSGRVVDPSQVSAKVASLPTLGLSNKAEETVTEEETDFEQLSSAPLEDHLQRHTLWPELEKLYGHGYEIVSVDTTNRGHQYVVSSCKSNNEKYAVLRVFDCESWLEVKPPLQFHDLTVTRVRISPNDQYILSTSRDRSVGVWKFGHNGKFELQHGLKKAHTRIVWDSDWAPNSEYFVTGSRDKTIKVWKLGTTPQDGSDGDGAGCETVASEKFSAAVTAVSVTESKNGNEFFTVAVGLEDGQIFVYEYSTKTSELKCLEQIESESCPGGRINRLAWNWPFLACASDDHSVRLYSQLMH